MKHGSGKMQKLGLELMGSKRIKGSKLLKRMP